MQAVLLIISGMVCFGLYRKRNMWGWIVLYWGVLVLKNAFELVGGI